MVLEDWAGKRAAFGRGAPHWCDAPLVVRLARPAAFRRLRRLDLLGFLEDFLDGDVDLEGNLYVLSDVKNHARIELGALRGLASLVRNAWFQSPARAARNVQSHYDAPPEALEAYLDTAYRSYTCAIFEDPFARRAADLVDEGSPDSLERAQARKFQEALSLLEVQPGDALLDVGTGYGGLLVEALGSFAPGRAVGWTHSRNQAEAARGRLASLGEGRAEIRQGDFREERRRFDRIASLGMVSHVGPRGLRPYARAVRRLIRPGGLYLHHDLMIEPGGLPQDLQVGPAFNKRYVWPGFHWFPLAEHVRVLEAEGFRVLDVTDLSAHYAKTTAAWYERLVARRQVVTAALGGAGFRAWQIFLAGISGSLDNGGVRDYRVLCRAL